MKNFPGLTRRTVELTLALVGFLAGCAHAPIVVNPRSGVSGDTSAMAIVDARKVEIPSNTSPKPQPQTVVGRWPGGITYVTPEGETAGKLVAGVVATRFPAAKVTLDEFSSSVRPGMWTQDFLVSIAATIEDGGRKFVVSGRGENSMGIINQRNIEISIERALSDFATNLAKVPSAIATAP